MQSKKYVFVDLDGTILDHSTHDIPKSAKYAIKTAMENGHEIVLTTGRPPCLFYGIDKQLNLLSFIGANGRIVVSQGEIIGSDAIEKSDIKKLVDICEEEKIDIAFEGMNEFVLQSKYDNIYLKFSENFHLEVPKLKKDFYLDNDVFQITFYYQKDDFKKYEEVFPNLSFAFSCEYGIDVNTKGGLKEKGIKVFMDKYDLVQNDIIAIGDGFNDISMLQFVDNSVAMGNAHEDVKVHAKYVTTHISDDGLYNAFKKFNLI